MPLSYALVAACALLLGSCIAVMPARAETVTLVCNWTWHYPHGDRPEAVPTKIVIDIARQRIDMRQTYGHTADVPAQITPDEIRWRTTLHDDHSLEATGSLDRTTGAINETVCQSANCLNATAICHKAERQF